MACLAGISSAAPLNPLIVVTGTRMPGMSGTEFIHRLREQNPGLPIVHISGSPATAYDLPSDVRTLFKPFDLPDLVPTVRQLLAA